MRAAALALALTLLALPAAAVQPDEVLADPALETRARAISQLLRCPVCQGETIDDSNAQIARDLRLYVRERLVAGDSDEAVTRAVAERFGEFVLFRPSARGVNLLLWLAGPLMLLAGLVVAALWMRRGRAAPPPAPLSEEEEARLARLLEPGAAEAGPPQARV